MMQSPPRFGFGALILLVAITASGLFHEGFSRPDFLRSFIFFLCGILGLWGVYTFSRLKAVDFRRNRPFFLMLGFLLVFVLMHLVFLLPLPAGLVKLISPSWRIVLTTAKEAEIQMPGWIPLSVAPEAAWRSFHQAVAATCLFLAAGLLCFRPAYARVLLITVATIAVAEGIIAVYRFVRMDIDRAHGGIFNPNHSAAIIAIGLPIAIGLLASRAKVDLQNRPRVEVRDRLLLTSGFILFAALGWLLTFSRASIASGIAALVLWAVWEWRIQLRIRSIPQGRLIGASAIVILLLPSLLFASVIAEGLGSRLNTSGESLISRLELWQASLRGLFDTFLLGLGPGGTEYAINRYIEDVAAKKNPVWAHNDYIQFLCDFGILGAAAASYILYKVGKSLHRMLFSNPPAGFRRYGILVRAASAGAFSVLAQSFLDFSLRIHGWFCVSDNLRVYNDSTSARLWLGGCQ
jgi:hypothetical protein